MDFITCMMKNVEAKKLTREKADKAIGVYTRIFEDAKKTMSDTAAVDYASIKAVESFTKMTHAKTWARVNELRKTARLQSMMMGSMRPDNELIKVGDMLELAQRRILAQADDIMARAINEHRPRFAGTWRPAKHSDNIIDAIYGKSVGDEAAVAMADDFRKVTDFFIKRANMEGASIEKLPQGRLGIVQDAAKIRKMERDGKSALAVKEEWIKDHMDTVDWTLMDREIAEEAKIEILGKRYDAIMTEGNSIRSSGFFAASLAENMNGKNRALYFKSAEDWKFINKKYGAGNVYQQMISEREMWSKDIAQLEVLGPNPVAMLQHLTKEGGLAMNRAAYVSNNPKGIGRNLINKTRAQARGLVNRYQIFAHLTANGEHSNGIQLIATTRSLALSTILSGAFIANLGDLGFGVHQAIVNKIPAWGYMGRVIKNFASMPSEEARMHALRSGLIGDGMTEMALNAQRYLGAFDGYHWARTVSDVVFRAQGLNAWTQASRWAWGQHLLGAFADNARKGWQELPIRESLERYGITEKDWDLFRSTEINTERGPMLRPIDLAKRTDIDQVTAQRTADKFFDFVNDTGKRAVPSVDTRTQVALGGHLDANSLPGQVMRTFGALKSFPMFILMMHLRDGFMQSTPRGKMGYLFTLGLMMTIAGAGITQLKDLAKGRDPRNMNPLEKGGLSFWGRAVLNGGSLGFLGDALFTGINNYRGGGLADVFAGPYTEYLNSAREATIGVLESAVLGEDLKLQERLSDFGSRHLPIPWPVKLMAERWMLDEIMQWADPNARRNALRRERNRQNLIGQKSWWQPYKDRPSRGPDWGAAWR